jgi:hypothetical protein
MAMPSTPARHRIEEDDPPGRIRAKALPGTVARDAGGLEAAMGRAGPGKPLAAAERAFFEPRFGRDLGAVRLHDDPASAAAAESISAQAFTLGSDIYLGAKAQGPRGTEGRRLLAHELTHVAQQQAMTAPNLVQRRPTFPDETCAEVRGGIEAAWPTSQRWVQVARNRLSNPSAVAGALQRHFKIDPEDPAHGADLTVVRDSFRRQEGLFDTAMRQEGLFDTAIFNICTPPDGDCASSTRDGGEFAARAHRGPPEWGIEHCLDSARTGFLTRRPLIETLVHEMAHLADPLCTDYAYRGTDVITSYEDMTRAQAVRNADSYSEFAHQMFLGPSVGRAGRLAPATTSAAKAASRSSIWSAASISSLLWTRHRESPRRATSAAPWTSASSLAPPRPGCSPTCVLAASTWPTWPKRSPPAPASPPAP